ncbi:MAG: hypothetical protein LBC42_02365, partial [Puniceicoccales bacterium]|nr:hypothetical protein [Puniceicoccales bacterium]
MAETNKITNASSHDQNFHEKPHSIPFATKVLYAAGTLFMLPAIGSGLWWSYVGLAVAVPTPVGPAILVVIV